MDKILIPSVEQRISTWNELLDKKKKEPKKEKKVQTITISREFGCEGYPLAESLKKKLEAKTGENWCIFDKALIENILEDHMIARNLLENLGERDWFLDNLISNLMPFWKSDAEIFKLMAETIYGIAQAGNAIIVGRGAAILTQDISHCFHFRMEATESYRIHSLERRINISQDEAKKLMEEKQAKRVRFINKFLDCDVTDIKYYHAIYNNEKLAVDNIAQSIIDFLNHNSGK